MIQTYTLADADQPHDHGGEPVAPLASDGSPFTYAWRRPERRETVYATTADALLAHIIAGYDPSSSSDPAVVDQLEDRRLERRSRHALGVAVNHAARAIMAGADEQVVETLQRSTDYTRPLDERELPEWSHDIPLLLIAPFYGADQPHRAPSGNVVMLRVEDPDDYLHDLHRAGAIILWEHSQSTSPELSVSVGLDPDPAQFVPHRLADLDEALTALAADPNELNQYLVRQRATALLDVLAAAPMPGFAPDAIRAALDTAGTPTDLKSVAATKLSTPLHEALDSSTPDGPAAEAATTTANSQGQE